MDKLGKSTTDRIIPSVMMVSGVMYEYARKRLSYYIHQEDPFLNAQIDQIHVGGNEVTMVPRLGTSDISDRLKIIR